MPLFVKKKMKGEVIKKKDERRRMYAWIKMEWKTEFLSEIKKKGESIK